MENQLNQETSPYLLQHADNPVHWHTWNQESLNLALKLNKPILLSIGYSTCHWCHVMAHESFEDDATAKLMNKLFINIKVDREERPDLDKIYQNAHSLLTERPGGWPLTLFLTPDKHMPIFAGTYFPKEPMQGVISFAQLLEEVNDAWQQRQQDIQQQSNALNSTYKKIYQLTQPADTDINSSQGDIARSQLIKQFDPAHGGFSTAPKFPHPSIIQFALQHWASSQQLHKQDLEILHSAIYTLEKMASGGVFDQLGGGFFRYSTDNHWMIPHFEKMLCDNGSLLSLYVESWQLNSSPLFFDTATRTAEWAIREMQSEKGGYYCAQDADTEGDEGKFFVWQPGVVKKTLSKSGMSARSIEIFCKQFGLNNAANFEGNWHLHSTIAEKQLADQYLLDEPLLHQQLSQAREALFSEREKRTHPETDRKILTAWNGLMIHGMARAGRVLKQEKYIESARSAAYYLYKHAMHDDRLYASVTHDQARYPAYLDDYAFLLYGLLELLQGQWDNILYDWSLKLADNLLDDFEDKGYGGFFFTSHQHEDLIQRIKTFSDEATPSGNAVAALSLNRLGLISGRTHYIEAASRCVKSAWNSITHYPISCCSMLGALQEILDQPEIIYIRYSECPPDTSGFYLPRTLIFTIGVEPQLAEPLSNKVLDGNLTAYPCKGFKCHNPLKTEEELREHLRNNSYRILE